MNYDEMDGDRQRLPANRNCYRLSRVSWALLKLLVYYNLKKCYPVLKIFWYPYSRHNWPSNGRLVFHLTQRLLLHYLVKQSRQICIKINKKLYTSYNFICLNMWPPTANYKKQLVKSWLVWSRTSSTLLSTIFNAECVSEPSPYSWANISNIFAGSWKMDN